MSPLAGFYGWSIDNVSVVGFVPEGVATRALASAMADGSVTVDLEWGARVPALDVGFQRWHVGWIRSIRTVARDPAIHIADLVGEWWHT
ncbi:MAG: hypothetical protein HUU30_04235 [Burkholderiaceae bacterium]|nr:hypothetical protein [Aquabacterium sp.]NUP84948.1 hypothetical protein [Burkholderiaceae bacterium]